MNRVTTEQIRETLASEFESDEPDAILEILRRESGKQLTTRLTAKLPGGDERWLIQRAYGMTHLRTRDYLRTGGNTGYSYLLSHAEKGVTIDPSFVEKHNSCYFAGRRERNVKRLACMHDATAIANMCDVINLRLAALEALERADAALDSYVDGAWDADRYTWRKLAGDK